MIKNNKCPNCGGFYRYSPSDKGLKCANCGEVVAIEDKPIKFHDYEENKNNISKDFLKETRQIRCQECGANMVVNSYDMIDKCSYCGCQALIDVESTSKMSPDAILPFSFDRKKAEELFKEDFKKRKFLPNVLKKNLPKTTASPNYLSTYIFYCEVKANYYGILEYDEEIKEDVTKTITKTKNVAGIIYHGPNNNIIECSTLTNQYDFDHLGRFDLTDLKSYSPEYLMGASAEYSNKSLTEANRDLEKMLKSQIERKILAENHCQRVVSLHMDLTYKTKKYVYALVPTYAFNYKYKDKNYKALMNGQTGKVTGEYPRSPLKIIGLVALILLLITFCIIMFLK